MKLRDAFICIQCDEVFSINEYPITKDRSECPSCGNFQIMNLSVILDKEAKPDAYYRFGREGI